MSRPCSALGCGRRVPERYLMCRKHWATVPRDVRKAWSITLRQYRSRPNRSSALTVVENRRELVRIVAAIERGEAA